MPRTSTRTRAASCGTARAGTTCSTRPTTPRRARLRRAVPPGSSRTRWRGSLHLGQSAPRTPSAPPRATTPPTGATRSSTPTRTATGGRSSWRRGTARSADRRRGVVARSSATACGPGGRPHRCGTRRFFVAGVPRALPNGAVVVPRLLRVHRPLRHPVPHVPLPRRATTRPRARHHRRTRVPAAKSAEWNKQAPLLRLDRVAAGRAR